MIMWKSDWGKISQHQPSLAFTWACMGNVHTNPYMYTHVHRHVPTGTHPFAHTLYICMHTHGHRHVHISTHTYTCTTKRKIKRNTRYPSTIHSLNSCTTSITSEYPYQLWPSHQSWFGTLFKFSEPQSPQLYCRENKCPERQRRPYL